MVGRVRALLDGPQAAARLSATLLVAAMVTLGSMFTPFVTQGCIFCPVDYTFPGRSVFQGLDGWIALAVGVALLFFSVVLLTIRRERRTAIVCAALAAAALVLCIVERADAAGRVIGLDAVAPPVVLGVPGTPVAGIPPPVYTDFGFYVFLVSSIVALIAAIGIVVTLTRNAPPDRTTATAIA
jgi:hypothetical protein